MVYYPVRFNRLAIPDLQSKAASAERNAHAAQNAISALQGDVERLLILTEALWTLLKRQQKLDDDVLVKLIEEIDQRDRPARPSCNDHGEGVSFLRAAGG